MMKTKFKLIHKLKPKLLSQSSKEREETFMKLP